MYLAITEVPKKWFFSDFIISMTAKHYARDILKILKKYPLIANLKLY